MPTIGKKQIWKRLGEIRTELNTEISDARAMILLGELKILGEFFPAEVTLTETEKALCLK